MATVIYTPVDEREHKQNIGAELQAFLEAMSLVEFGSLPAELLKKIA